MMYHYITLADETEIVHSHLIQEGENNIIEVHFERPTENGFDSARIKLPTYEWIMRDGFSDEEIKSFEEFSARHAHLMYYHAENGGIINA